MERNYSLHCPISYCLSQFCTNSYISHTHTNTYINTNIYVGSIWHSSRLRVAQSYTLNWGQGLNTIPALQTGTTGFLSFQVSAQCFSTNHVGDLLLNELTDCKALIKICQKINYGKDTRKNTVFLILLRLTDVLMSAREWWTQGP